MEPKQQLSHDAVIITGMHRSGTSLTTSILQKVGVNIGENLYLETEGNIKGHYEDLDFLTFHQSVLQSRGLDLGGWITEKQVLVPEEYIPKAKNIINSRLERNQAWGWKDPRTTLFLNFWKELLPEAKYIFVYRSPWEVVDSLFRRGTDLILIDEPKLAIETWFSYNSALMDFYMANSERILLIHDDNLVGLAESFLASINEKLNIPVGKLEKPVFDVSLMHKDIVLSHRSTLLIQHFPEALELYENLNERADLSPITSDSILNEGRAEKVDEEYFLRDWVEIRLRDKENRLYQSKFNQAQIELQATQVELQATQVELQATQVELQATQVELQATQVELQATQASASHLKHLIQAMESSKFWKLREAWLNLKKRLKKSFSIE